MLAAHQNFFLTMRNNLQHMRLKLLLKKSFKKEQKQMAICFAIKLLIKLQKSQNIYQRIIQEQLERKQKK